MAKSDNFTIAGSIVISVISQNGVQPARYMSNLTDLIVKGFIFNCKWQLSEIIIVMQNLPDLRRTYSEPDS